MMKARSVFIVFLLSSFIVMSLFKATYAAFVEVTDENLNSSFQKFMTSGENENNLQITVEDGQIKITSEEGNYVINYDLTNKPTFTYETEVAQGMSYNDFKEKEAGSSLMMLCYIIVADIQGVEFEDSIIYFSRCLLRQAFSGTSSTNLNNTYKVIDDTQGGNIIAGGTNDSKTIYASEFGNHVMEYVNSIYTENQTYKDNDDDQFNTFEMTTEMKDKTSTSCKLVTSLIVNTDADFSKLKDYSDQMENLIDISNSNSTSTTNGNTSINKTNETNETANEENQVANISVMPKTGEKQNPLLTALYILITCTAIGIFGLIMARKKA